jgi:DNA-binding beta-propeller fold protein YncE
MHMHPRVRELEERFADVLVVVGVHAGKFPAERATPRIRSACARLGLSHPVVNDRQFRIWRSYGVQAWPTIALVTPDGYVVTVRPGEFPVEEIAGTISRLADAHRATGDLDTAPRDFGRDPLGAPADDGAGSVLRFPGRVLAAGERLYVSDTGNRRVLALRLLEGLARAAEAPRASIESVWGSGEEGFEDGESEHAGFREPQGLALHGGTLYVADRTNHAIRAIGLADHAVRTVAGTGELAASRLTPGRGPSTSLRSPWGLAVWRGGLAIAMAGSHQLWTLTLDGRELLSPLAGSGGEDLTDGRAERALLAQPTGLAAAGEMLYFTDSESSAVRVVADGPEPRVATIAGTGLFDFGDRDGAGDDALLQHVEDIAWMDGSLYVTDTYNDKIKVLDPASRDCRALPGGAGSGATLAGPAGISAGAGRLWVADTDAHRVVAVDPSTGAVRPLAIE